MSTVKQPDTTATEEPVMAEANVPIDLDELERLDRDATAGPWEPCAASGSACQCALVWSPKDDAVVLTTAVYDASDVHYTRVQNTRNQQFVVAIRNAFPALAAELRRLRADNQRLRNEQPWLGVFTWHP